jgi:hypothetical protein
MRAGSPRLAESNGTRKRSPTSLSGHREQRRTSREKWVPSRLPPTFLRDCQAPVGTAADDFFNGKMAFGFGAARAPDFKNR